MEAGPEQELWYYDRCEFVTGRRFNHRWLERKSQSTWIPNSIIAAAWKFGKGKEVHQALKSAAMERGEPILQRAIALKLASEASGIDLETLASAIDDPGLAAELQESLSEFESYRIDQRPAFILHSAIGDTAVFSGLYRREPIFAAVEAMLHDEEKYAEHASSYPTDPDELSWHWGFASVLQPLRGIDNPQGGLLRGYHLTLITRVPIRAAFC